MKKIILFSLIITFSLITALNAYAAPTPSPEDLNKKIYEELKDKVASTVAKLNLVERRGVIGKVVDIADTQIKLTDVKGDTRFVDVDELTKFSSRTTGESIGISDIKKNDILGVLGLYNKQSRRILARSIKTITLPKMIHGYIATIDPENFSFHVATDENDQFDVSVETTTKSFGYDKDSEGLVRSGFSKLKADEKVFIRGTEDPKGKLSADVIIAFPDILKVKKPAEVLPSPVTSTGSGKKLTPIVK